MGDEHFEAIAERYAALYDKIIAKVKDEHVARTILSETAKDQRMQAIRDEREAQNGRPATARQLEYLKSLGVKVKPGLTKKQASSLIDEALEKEE